MNIILRLIKGINMAILVNKAVNSCSFNGKLILDIVGKRTPSRIQVLL